MNRKVRADSNVNVELPLVESDKRWDNFVAGSALGLLLVSKQRLISKLGMSHAEIDKKLES